MRLTQEERRLAAHAAKATNLLAIAGVDIIQSSRGPLVSEVNACPNFLGIEKATGVNVVGAIVDYLGQNNRRSVKKDKVGV